MSPTEVLAVLHTLAQRVPGRHVRVDRSMALAWHGDIGRMDAEAAVSAAESWTGDEFPSAGAFVAEIQRCQRALAAERADERAIAAPTVCAQCDGTGWVEVSYPPLTVKRCRCSAGRPSDVHRSGCTCRTCAGVVALRAPRTPRPGRAGRG